MPWVTYAQAADLLDCHVSLVDKLAAAGQLTSRRRRIARPRPGGGAGTATHVHRERLPAIENGGRYWVWRDHLEMVEAARLARKTRRP
jgi:hypothetical protein